jgi:hypothetical protein
MPTGEREMSGLKPNVVAHGKASPAGAKPGWPVRSKPPFTATVSSTMSEDYVATSDVLIGGANAPLAVFHDYGGATETLAICADNFLYHVARNLANESGWALAPVHQTSSVDQVAAGTNGLDNLVHAFFTAGGRLQHAALNADGSWTESGTMPLCAGLAVTNVPLSGELITYGVTSEGKLQVARWQDDGSWATATWTFPSPLDPDATLLQMIDDHNWALATKAATGLTIYTGADGAVAPDPMHLSTPAPVAQLLVGYAHQNSVLFLFTDTSGALYSNVHVTDVVAQIPNIKVSKARAGVDRAGLLHFYGTDEQGTLSVLHQTGWGQTGPAWAPCIPLDAGVALPAVSSNPRDVAAFFAVGQDGALRFLSQDPVTSSWTAARAQRPSTAKPYHLTTYRAQVSVVDANGNPAAALPLTLSASTAASVAISGASHLVSTTAHAALTTDQRGTVTLAMPALSLHAPLLTLSAEGLDPVTVTPDAGVHAYLSGGAGLNGKPPLTSSSLSSTLQTATTSDGSQLAPAAVGKPDLANAAANGIMHSFGAVAGSARATALADSGIVGFALDLNDLSKPSFTPFTSLADLEAHRAGMQASYVGLSWDDFVAFAEDVWHGIQQAASAVMHWVVDLAHKTVDLLTQIGDELVLLAGMAIDGIREVISIVHSICNRIEAFVEKVIDWLRAFFSWRDIWDTKLALEEALTKAVPFLVTFVDQRAAPLVSGFFSRLEQQVRNAFAAIPANATFADLAGGSSLALHTRSARGGGPRAVHSPVPARALLSGPQGSVSPGDFTADSQHNWLLDKLTTYFGVGPALTTTVDLSGPLGDLTAAFSTAGTQFTTALDNFATAAIAAIAAPQDLPATPLHHLLDPLEQMILAGLGFADHVIEALLGLVKAALTGLQAFLEIPLSELPVIGPLIGVIEGILGIDPSQVTITGVFCLVAAIPVTLAYKITHGADAKLFPGGKLQTAGTLSSPGRLGDPVADACKYCAVGATALWALFDSCLDLVPDAGNMVFSIIDVIFPTLIQVFTWPSGVPFTPIPDEQPLDKANLTNWSAGWAPILIDLAMLVAPELPFSPGIKPSIARYVDPWGKILLTGTGAFNLAAGLAAIGIDSSDGGAVAANILGPLPNASQALRIDGVVESSEGVTAALKVFLDFFTGTGCAVAMAAG